jgi:hypothetical protein
MSHSLQDYEDVCSSVNAYVEAARTGDFSQMDQVFHQDAYIFGWFDGEPFNGPIKMLFDWDVQNGPAPDIRTRIVSVEIAETVASARLEIENWTGYTFADFFTLMKFGDEWKIMNKVFHKYGFGRAS